MQVLAHGLHEHAVLVYDSRFGDLLAIEKVEYFARHFGHIFTGQVELVGVPKHRLVEVVDKLAPALRNLTREGDGTGEGSAEGPTPSTRTGCGIVQGHSHPGLMKFAAAGTTDRLFRGDIQALGKVCDAH